MKSSANGNGVRSLPFGSSRLAVIGWLSGSARFLLATAFSVSLSILAHGAYAASCTNTANGLNTCSGTDLPIGAGGSTSYIDISSTNGRVYFGSGVGSGGTGATANIDPSTGAASFESMSVTNGNLVDSGSLVLNNGQTTFNPTGANAYVGGGHFVTGANTGGLVLDAGPSSLGSYSGVYIRSDATAGQPYGSYTDLMVISSDGNVGIGVPDGFTGTSKFEVNGTTQLDSTLTVDGATTINGSSAGGFKNLTINDGYIYMTQDTWGNNDAIWIDDDMISNTGGSLWLNQFGPNNSSVIVGSNANPPTITESFQIPQGNFYMNNGNMYVWGGSAQFRQEVDIGTSAGGSTANLCLNGTCVTSLSSSSGGGGGGITVPNCSSGYYVTGNGSTLSCAAPPAPTAIPTCSSGQSLTANGSTLSCQSQIPTCASGQYLTSTNGTTMTCSSLPVTGGLYVANANIYGGGKQWNKMIKQGVTNSCGDPTTSPCNVYYNDCAWSLDSQNRIARWDYVTVNTNPDVPLTGSQYASYVSQGVTANSSGTYFVVVPNNFAFACTGANQPATSGGASWTENSNGTSAGDLQRFLPASSCYANSTAVWSDVQYVYGTGLPGDTAQYATTWNNQLCQNELCQAVYKSYPFQSEISGVCEADVNEYYYSGSSDVSDQYTGSCYAASGAGSRQTADSGTTNSNTIGQIYVDDFSLSVNCIFAQGVSVTSYQFSP